MPREHPGEVIACPGRDVAVHPGDWTAMIGTADELTERGIKIAKPIPVAPRERPLVHRLADTVRAFHDDINPMFYRAFAAAIMLLVGSTVLLRFAYRHPGMSWMDALYFSTETIATVGYGDFNFLNQPLWLRLWGVGMMFAGVTTTAIVVAFVADVLLSRRLTQTTNRQKARHLRRHVVVVGLGSFGIRVASMIKAAGHDVAVIERNEDNRYLSGACELDVPVIFGDATLRQTLESARLEQARAVAVLTQDDMVNIETGIVIREMIGNPRVVPEFHRPHVPIVLRIYDQQLGHAVGHRFGFEFVRSTVDLATPWFIGAAMGLRGARHLLGGPAVVHGRRGEGAPGQRAGRDADVRAVHPDPGDRHRAGRDRRCGCIRAARPSWPPATPPTSSGPTGSSSTRCARASAPPSPARSGADHEDRLNNAPVGLTHRDRNAHGGDEARFPPWR